MPTGDVAGPVTGPYTIAKKSAARQAPIRERPMACSFSLRLLGTLAIIREGGTAGPPLTGQALALLAILACAGERGVARDKLLAILWPESDASAASHRLSQLVHWIRRTVESPTLIDGT